MYTTNAQGVKRMRKTTCGWQLLVIGMMVQSNGFLCLFSSKESNPVDIIAEYVTSCGIDKEPAFAWRVPYTLHKCDAIVASISACARKTTLLINMVLKSREALHTLTPLTNAAKQWKHFMRYCSQEGNA
jgi:hypothetical protein